MIALLVAKGVPVATAVAATLLIRFTTLGLGIALGLTMLAVWSYAWRYTSGDPRDAGEPNLLEHSSTGPQTQQQRQFVSRPPAAAPTGMTLPLAQRYDPHAQDKPRKH